MKPMEEVAVLTEKKRHPPFLNEGEGDCVESSNSPNQEDESSCSSSSNLNSNDNSNKSNHCNTPLDNKNLFKNGDNIYNNLYTTTNNNNINNNNTISNTSPVDTIQQKTIPTNADQLPSSNGQLSNHLINNKNNKNISNRNDSSSNTRMPEPIDNNNNKNNESGVYPNSNYSKNNLQQGNNHLPRPGQMIGPHNNHPPTISMPNYPPGFINPHNVANIQYQMNPVFGPGAPMGGGQQGMLNYSMGMNGMPMRGRHMTGVNIMPPNPNITPQQLQLQQQQQMQQQQLQQHQQLQQQQMQMQQQQQTHWPQQFLIQHNNSNGIPFTVPGKLMNGFITNAPQPFISKDNLVPSPIIFQPNYNSHPEHKSFPDSHASKKEHKKNKNKETCLSPISDYEADNYTSSDFSSTHSSSKKSNGVKAKKNSMPSSINPQQESQMAQSNVFNKLCSLGEEGDRRQLLTELFNLMASKATPITVMPVVCRQTVDLFKLYNIVKSYGGLETVCKMKQWRDVSSSMGFGGSTSAGFALKKTYCKYLFTYECKFDRNDADPTPILVSLDLVSKLETKKKAASTSSSVDGNTKEDSQDSFHELTNNNHNNSSTNSNHNNFNPHLDEANIKHQTKAKEKTVFFNYNDDFSSIRNRSMGMVFNGTQNKIQTFPVENVMKRRFKRRKIYHRDIVRVELRKVGLALTSGMLAEVSWAIDYLAVFTHDPVSAHLDVSKHARLFDSLMNLFVLCMQELVETMRERDHSIKNGKLLDSSIEKEFSGKEETFMKKERSEEDIEFMEEETKKYYSELESVKEVKADGDNVHVEDNNTFNFRTHTYNTFFGTDLQKNHPCLFSLKGELDHKNVFYNSVHHPRDSTKKLRLEDLKEDEAITHENDKIEDEHKSYEMKYPSTTQASQGFHDDSVDSPSAFCRTYLEELASASAVGCDVTEAGEDLFNNTQEKQDLLARKCICISNVLRNLALQAVNEKEMATSLKFITLASHFLLFDHQHPPKQDSPATEAVPDLENEVDKLWWSGTSSNIRSNFIVALSSIATHISLFSLPGDVCMQLCSGLLHWAICQSSEALDLHSGLSISIQRIVFETLTKLCMQRENTDFLLATPPFSRLVKLVQYMVEVLYLEESEVERDILLGLLSRLVEGDSRVARILVIDGTAPLILIGLIENYMNTLVMREQSKYMEGFNVSEQFHEISAYTACKASEIFRSLTDNPENASLLGKFRKHFLEMSTNDLQDDNITANICHVIATLA